MFILTLTACDRNKDIPSDNEMIEKYNDHKEAFETIKQIGSKYNSFHYPLFRETDSIEISLSEDDRNILDSLLQELGIQRIFFYHNRESLIKSEIDNIEIELLYYSWGLSVSGGSKEYVYKPN